MIFHRYVSLPEGSMLQNDATLKCNENDIWPFGKQQIWSNLDTHKPIVHMASVSDPIPLNCHIIRWGRPMP